MSPIAPNDLAVFLAVARRRSFRKAADELGVAPPASHMTATGPLLCMGLFSIFLFWERKLGRLWRGNAAGCQNPAAPSAR
jgi:Bacterial regulatory helix-turn-helix protein, lysR family